MFGGDTDAVAASERELDAIEADLALSRGRAAHLRVLADRRLEPAELAHFERAATLYRQLGDMPGEAEAEFWIGCYHQVCADNTALALPHLDRALSLAEGRGRT